MRHKLLVLTVKKFLQSVYIYGSYRKIKTGVPFFWTTRYVHLLCYGCIPSGGDVYVPLTYFLNPVLTFLLTD